MSEPSWFKKSMRTGGALSSAIQIVNYFWPAITAGALGTAIAVFWSGSIEWIQKPTVYIPALVFGYLFLIVSSLRPRIVRSATEYEYGITTEGQWTAILSKFPANHPTDANADGVILILNVRSACPAPIRLQIEEFDVVLDSRTYANQPPIREVVVPRFSAKGVKSAVVVRDPKKTQLSGSATIKLLYGPMKGKEMRQYTLKCDLNVVINPTSAGTQIGVLSQIMDEEDRSYVEG
jgi:hypothetical protein